MVRPNNTTFVNRDEKGRTGTYLDSSVGIPNGRVAMQLLEHIADLQTRSFPYYHETAGDSYHPLCELPDPIFIFLLTQRFLCPLLDESWILDFFPPIGFLPNDIRESAHPHFDDLNFSVKLRSLRVILGNPTVLGCSLPSSLE